MSDHDHAPAAAQDGNCDYHSVVFHTGHSEVLFFPELRISTAQQLLAACMMVFMMAFVNEGLRMFVSWLHCLLNAQQKVPTQPGRQAGYSGQPVWALGVVHTFSHILHLLVHYCLMLIFMTLNVWLCLSLLLGAGAGFVLFHFRPVKSRVFGLFGAREQPPKDTEEEEERENCSEMTDMGNKQLDGCKWNGADSKEK